MKKIYLFLLLLLASVTGYASHIAGGDLRVVFRSQSAAGPIYRIVANIYHDPTGISLNAQYTINIFRKSNNTQIGSVIVNLRSYVLAPYPTDNPVCAAIALKTGIYLYDRELVLDPAIYNEAAGYYVTASDCCRNGSVTNIDQNSFTFYAEFPRVTNAAVAPFTVADAFVNSTPDFRILQAAYLCLNQPFTNDFSASDPDGDQLTYDLVKPLNSSINDPYEFIAPLYSLENAFGSISPSGYLRINPTTGIVTVTPGVVGTFAFAIRCTESRNGIKIGETRREFQYLVRNDCAPLVSPVPRLPDGPGTVVGGIYILDLNNGPSLDFTIKGSRGKQISKIDIIPVSANFTTAELDVNKIFSPNPSSAGVPLNPVTGEGKVKLTWPPCLYSKSATDIYEFDMILIDNSCPVSNSATARIKLKVLQRNNPMPKWEISNTTNIAVIDQAGSISVTSAPIVVGDSVKFTIVGRDLGDSLRIRARAASDGEYFTFIPKNIQYTTPSTSKDVALAEFIWAPQCSLVRNNGRREELILDIFIEERASCERLRTTVKVKLILEDNGVTSEYQPINVFTPNGDGKNEEYTLPQLRNAKCLYTFKKITIHNRYGKEVFQSEKEDFKWAAKDNSAGLYYYRIEYENYEYKGSLQVLR